MVIDHANDALCCDPIPPLRGMTEHTAVPELTSELFSTSSEEWRHECELRHVLAMARPDREAFFNGVEDTWNRDIVVLGPAATSA